MKAGSKAAVTRGTFVISWSQTEVEGSRAAPLALLRPGATWRWQGEAIRIDGPPALLRLEGAIGAEELRARAARTIRRLVGPLPQPVAVDLPETPAQGFSITDGHRTWTLALVRLPETGGCLLTGRGTPPPCDRDLWLVDVALDRVRLLPANPAGAGLTPGTRIATAQGPRRVETLTPGDRILTRDAGAQPLLWIGQRRVSGARLHAMPALRPIRIKAGALGPGQPEADLRVSPRHRLALQGPAARALFSADEVLVEACHLVNDLTIRSDLAAREAVYFDLLLPSHQLIWANGLLTESFHPALARPDPAQLAGLHAIFPDLAADPSAYGPPARRNLTGPEAAILAHAPGNPTTGSQ